MKATLKPTELKIPMPTINSPKKSMQDLNTEANELRLMANEIMYKLYLLDQKDQLEILKNYAQSAIDNINKKLPN